MPASKDPYSSARSSLGREGGSIRVYARLVGVSRINISLGGIIVPKLLIIVPKPTYNYRPNLCDDIYLLRAYIVLSRRIKVT